MSHQTSKHNSLSRSNTSVHKELFIWYALEILRFQSLSIQEKCRATRVTSTELTNLIFKKLVDLDLINEIPNKPINAKKTKQKGESTKALEQPSYTDALFESLLVFSEVDFLDSIGLDFNLIKDSSRMIDILTGLMNKNSGSFSHKIPNPSEINSKQDISIFVALMIFNQIEQARVLSKFPIDHSWRRRDIGNFWSYLESEQRSPLLYLQYPNIPELIKNLCKKGIIVSSDVIQKQIRELMKLQKSQFCNRILKCRIKRAVNDPIKQYHRLLFCSIADRIKSQKKKKELIKLTNSEQYQSKKDSEPKQLPKLQTGSRLKRIDFSPDSESKQNQSEQLDSRAKSYSVSSNDTNETQSKLDFKYFGQNLFQKKIEKLYKYKMTSDLVQFGDIIGEKANSYQKYRLVAFDRIQCIVGVFQVQLLLYGSCANGLMVQNSDIDVAIAHNILNYFPYGSLKDRVVCALSHLNDVFHQQPWVTKITLITTASIPVLKLQIDTSVKIDCPQGLTDDNNTFKGYPQDKVKIDVDITIDTSLFEGEFTHLGIQATQLMKDWMQQIPNLYSISIFLKYLFQKKQFNSTYRGGIGSYCMMVMILAYLKYYEKQNQDLATQMQGVISFFSEEFDENAKGIDLRDNVLFYLKEMTDNKLQVKDPINGRIMTRNTYLYSIIKQQLMSIKKKCFDLIRDQVFQHISGITEKQQREQVLNLGQKQYFTRYQSFYSKNIFCEYKFT